MYQHRYIKETNVVLATSASVQVIHGLKANKTTWPYSGSAMEEQNGAIESFVDSPYNNCSTDSRNDEICTAAEHIFGVSCECSERSVGKLLEFLCSMSLTSTDFRDHLYSLEACPKILEDEIPETIFCVNMEQMMLSISANSGKRELHIFYVQNPLEVIRAQMKLARKDQVFTTPLL